MKLIVMIGRLFYKKNQAKTFGLIFLLYFMSLLCVLQFFTNK